MFFVYVFFYFTSLSPTTEQACLPALVNASLVYVQTTAGGILIPTNASTGPSMEAMVGTVVALGDEVEVSVKVGDRVLFSKYGSSDVEVPGGDVCFVAQKSIMAVLS
jgi:chaperonin GroES